MSPSGTDRSDPPLPSSSAAHTPSRTGDALDTQRVLGVFGASSRGGAWEPAERVEAVSVFGGVTLDFREATLYDVTQVSCFCLFGSIDVLVSRDVEVDANGVGIFGGFEERRRGKSVAGVIGRALRGEPAHEESLEDPPEDPPLLRIRGFALFGSVTVRVG
jgi:hypothetical protein